MSVLLRNRVAVSGRGKQAMVMVHGFGVDQRAWDRVLPAFEDDYRIIRYDLTGLGRSDLSAYDTQRHASLHGHADELREICAALSVDDAVLLGHSAGGMIGLLAGVAQPGLFQKLIMISSSPRYLNDADYVGGFERAQADEVIHAVASDYVAWCNATVPVVVGEGATPAVTEQVMQGFRRVAPEIALHVFRAILYSDHRADLARMEQPTLVLQATRDAFVPVEVAHYLAAQLPLGSLHVMRGHGGHFPHLGAPHDVVRAVKDFLWNPLA
jgi:sigma-B regulation protein RsbQ